MYEEDDGRDPVYPVLRQNVASHNVYVT
jgi:hypothetical protein